MIDNYDDIINLLTTTMISSTCRIMCRRGIPR